MKTPISIFVLLSVVVLGLLLVPSSLAGKGSTIVMGGQGGMGGGLVVSEGAIIGGGGFGFGYPVVIAGGKKGRNIIWGKRKRRSIMYVIPTKK